MRLDRFVAGCKIAAARFFFPSFFGIKFRRRHQSSRLYPKATDMADEAPGINIGVLSLGWEESIERHLMSTIRTCKTNLEFISLAPTDLNVYTAPKKFNAVILLHSTTEGRLSLTDVPDARYKTLLPTLSKQYGKKHLSFSFQRS